MTDVWNNPNQLVLKKYLASLNSNEQQHDDQSVQHTELNYSFKATVSYYCNYTGHSKHVYLK